LSTALVAIAAQGHTAPDGLGTKDRLGTNRPRADFIAQLIATATAAPQTRARRRAEPDEAIAAYAALDQRPASSGCTVSRSL
jgi:hypothetical protein